MVRNDVHDRDENDHRKGETNHIANIDDVDTSSDIVMINDPGMNETDVLIPTGGAEQDVSAKKRGTRKALSPSNKGSGGMPGRRKVRKAKDGSGSSSSSTTESENAQAICIKYSALFLLVAQMVGLVLLMRHSRTSKRNEGEPLYLASTAVFVMEVMKLVICFGVVAYQTGLSRFASEIHYHVIGSPMEMLKLCVPSLLYTVQNNLLYLALTNLDAATYQVCYQLKILTTALFSALLLQRTFSATKWASLVVLTVGVAIVQLSGSGDQHSSTTTNSDHHEAELEKADQVENHNRWIGLIAVICAACTSGFSGVYFGTESCRNLSVDAVWTQVFSIGSKYAFAFHNISLTYANMFDSVLEFLLLFIFKIQKKS
jgi:UDP-galactose transporter